MCSSDKLVRFYYVTEIGEIIFILGEVKGSSSEGNGTGLYWVERFSVIKSFDLFVDRSVDSVSWVTVNGGTCSIFVQQEDQQDRPNFLHANLVLEQFNFRLQLQQLTKRSPLFDFFVGGDFKVLSSANTLALLGSLKDGVSMFNLHFSVFYI